MNPKNLEGLLARVTDPKMRAAAAKSLAAAEKLAAKKTELARSGTLTEAGVRAALKDALPTIVREHQAAAAPIAKLAAQAKAKRDGLGVRSADPTTPAAVIEQANRAEIRAWLRTLPPAEMAQLAMSTEDARILESMLSAPPELVNLRGNQRDLAEKIEQRYLEMTFPAELAEAERLEQAAAEAADVAKVALNEIKAVADVDAHTFAQIEARIGAPWLIKNTNSVQVVDFGDDGKVNYRDASPAEIESGVYYKNETEWRAARAAA